MGAETDVGAEPDAGREPNVGDEPDAGREPSVGAESETGRAADEGAEPRSGEDPVASRVMTVVSPGTGTANRRELATHVRVAPGSAAGLAPWPALQAPVTVCLLGSFRLLKRGASVPVRPGGKTEALLGALALRGPDGLGREELLGLVWPTSEEALATQALNTLVHSIGRRLGDALGGQSPVVRREGRYRLNAEQGVAVDVRAFEAAADDGDRLGRSGDALAALRAYDSAVALYEGDLVLAVTVGHLLERERLRARYLSIHARLADGDFAGGEYGDALRHALAVLAGDPCREDAHRMVMRCHVRLGERAQALRHYRVCREVLALEFEVEPEPATRALFEQIRLDPSDV